MAAWRIGLVGLGVVSRFYLGALADSPSLRLVAVCDRDVGRLRRWRGEVACYGNHQRMLRRGDLDAVVVCTPNDSHAPVCRDALQAGVAVCVEKPLATRLADGTALVRTAERCGVPLFTAFHRRYNAAVRALLQRLGPRREIDEVVVRYLERIEDHATGDAWYLDPARCGGGCVADNGTNAYDLVRLLLGRVEVVDAAIHRDHRGADRQASILLRASSGPTARVELDWSYPGERKEVVVRRTDGRTDRADMLAGHPGFKASLWHEYVGVLEHFSRVLASGASDDAGLEALALVHATYQAERQHGHCSTGTGRSRG